MKLAIWAWSTAVAVIGGGSPEQAGPVEQACDFAYKQLSAVPHLSLIKSTGSFSVNSHSYDGCIVRLKGDRKRVDDAQYPAPLFYPSEGTALYQQGWRADIEADGPDGTSFRISKQTVFCLVEGNWDGGDDSDPKYVPSTRYEVIVSCSDQKQ
jgi:hypothetical protein